MPDYIGKYTTVENGQPKYDINQLADKWLKGTITSEEKAYYEKWYGSFDDSETQFKKEISQTSSELSEKIYSGLNSRIQATEKQDRKKVYPLRWLAIAASILLCLSFGGYFLLRKQVSQQYAQSKAQDISPGSNKAVLHLANGHQITLQDAANGELNKRSGTSITKTADGSVVYSTNHAAAVMVYDTLTIPCAGTYNLTLADGSKVWLNAATAIRYPENFNGKERTVELLYGEAYFEVVHNVHSPFKVISANQVIEDIGTHFNINAYSDEGTIKTTLIEGSVKISANGDGKLLKPGQQAQISTHSPKISVVSGANVEEAIAWKNGYFRFNDEKIESIMRKLSKWYNIDVVYEGPITNESFYGKISRFRNISGVLDLLRGSKGVQFKVEGRRITVMQ